MENLGTFSFLAQPNSPTKPAFGRFQDIQYFIGEESTMSLQPLSSYRVPELTARVARAAFPKGTLCLRLYDELGTIFADHDFADLFAQRGQPAEAPFRLALITILQFLEGLSDRQAAEAVRARIDWKYLLCLDLEDPGFDYSILCEFRARLLAGGAEHRLFDQVLACLREHKLVKARTRQRTDSTHVVAAVRELNRLEKVVETLRAALNVLATVAPDWVRAQVPPEWVDRYRHRAEDYHLPAEANARERLAERVGTDGHSLLEKLWSPEAPAWLRSVPAVETLRQVWVQNFLLTEGAVRWRQRDNIPPAGVRISSPYDPEARYAHKRSTTWVGYKVHLTETCEDELPHLITQVQTDEAVRNDNEALPTIHQQLAQAELLPSIHLVDAGYIEAQQLLESQREYGVDLLGPAQSNGRWQQVQGNGFDLSHFQIEWEEKTAICPQGKRSAHWRPGVDGRGNAVISVVFAKAQCSHCPSLSQCTTAKDKRRTLTLRPRELHDTLQHARHREKTPEFKAEHKKRAGIEGTISQGVRSFGLRCARYVGKAKTHLQHLATAAAINLERVADWLAGVERERTRRSAFARVMLPLATTAL
jgi:transposase